MSELNAQVIVVVVTYNRCNQLLVTLEHYYKSFDQISHLIVVNNASTDETTSKIEKIVELWKGKLLVLNLPENLGGAGGFYEGVKKAAELGSKWIFISDDDAVPADHCLDKLLKAATNERDVYGAVAIAENSASKKLCWPVKPIVDSVSSSGGVLKKHYEELDSIEYPEMLPFLGFMISKESVQRIGYPNKDYFISGDDVEYGIRLCSSGSRLIQVKDAVMLHPEIPRLMINVLGKEFLVLRMPSWRRFLDVRNRIWNSRLAYGYLGMMYTCLSVIPHSVLICYTHPDKINQVRAITKGVFKGVFSKPKSHKSMGLLKESH